MLEMISIRRSWSLLAVVLALSPLVGCATTQYQAALDEREAENRALREERTRLKNELRDKDFQMGSLETALAEANARLLETPSMDEGMRTDPELDALGIGQGMRGGNMVFTVPTEITFKSGQATLSAGGKKALDAVARRLMSDYPDHEYWIEGHTDSDPIVKSKFGTNRNLSVQRALAVLHHLVENSGLTDQQCVVAGWGEYRPVANNDTNANKALNRRVEIIVRL